jgi:hypothetical protein
LTIGRVARDDSDVKPQPRAAVTALLVLLGMTASAWAGTSAGPYRVAPTRRCLIRNHAELIPGKYTTRVHQIQLVLGYGAGFPVTVEMEFSRNVTQAAAYERRLKHTYRVEMLSQTWIRHHLFRRQNVVVHPDVTAARLTASRVATILSCLRR